MQNNETERDVKNLHAPINLKQNQYPVALQNLKTNEYIIVKNANTYIRFNNNGSVIKVDFEQGLLPCMYAIKYNGLLNGEKSNEYRIMNIADVYTFYKATLRFLDKNVFQQ